MDAQAIIEALAQTDGLPEDAIRAARAQRDEIAPAFIDRIERYLEPDAVADDGLEQALFFIFHMLGEWRETSAYRPLARLLALDPETLELVLSDATVETSHRVMAAVFDGDPSPLYQVIEAEHADEFVRSRMFETLAMVTMSGQMDRAAAARYLRDSFATLKPHGASFVWQGWQSAIALLGLEELVSLVGKAFARRLIDPSWMSFKDFRADLRHALAHPEAPGRLVGEEFTLFGDTIEELGRWHSFSPEFLAARSRAAEPSMPDPGSFREPAINPFRGIGRNDPCPCGSGKKFKTCCLAP